jgi:hypothetical protein
MECPLSIWSASRIYSCFLGFVGASCHIRQSMLAACTRSFSHRARAQLALARLLSSEATVGPHEIRPPACRGLPRLKCLLFPSPRSHVSQLLSHLSQCLSLCQYPCTPLNLAIAITPISFSLEIPGSLFNDHLSGFSTIFRSQKGWPKFHGISTASGLSYY